MRYAGLIFAAQFLAAAQTVTLTASPSQINISGYASTNSARWQIVNISTNSSEYLRFWAASADSWMMVTSNPAYIRVGEPGSVGLIYVNGSLPAGQHRGSVTVYAPPAAPLVIPVVANLVDAVLSANPAAISVQGAAPAVLSVNVQVTYTLPAVLQAEAASQNGWLTLEKTYFGDSPANLVLRINTTVAPLGMNSGLVTLRANGVTKTVPVVLEVVTATKAMAVWPPRLDLLDGTNAQAPQGLEVRSLTGVAVPFTVEAAMAADWLHAPLGTWSAPARLPFSLDTTRLPTQAATSIMRLVPRDPTQEVLEVPVSFGRSAIGSGVIPQIADGGGFRTQITLVNDNPKEASVRMDLFRLISRTTRATEPWWPVFEGSPGWQQFRIPAFGVVSFETLGLPDQADSGWARVQSSLPVRGFAVYRQRQLSGRDQEASVPMLSERFSRFVLPFDQTGGQAAAMAVANGCGPAAQVSAAAVDDEGRLLGSTSLGSWPSLGHDAFLLSAALPVTAGRRGTVEFIGSPGCIAAVGLRFTSQGAFTSVDPQPPTRAYRLVFPQVADGGGFSTSLVITNLDIVPATVRLQFRGSGGEGAVWSSWDPGVPSTVTIAPSASVTVETSGAPEAATSGWAEATSSQRISGFAVFRRRQSPTELQEATVAGRAVGASRIVVPFDNTNGLVTSMAIVNGLTTAPLAAQVSIRDTAGQVVKSGAMQLGAGGHAAFEVPRRFPETDGKAGSLEISAPGGYLYVLPLRFAPGGAFTSVRVAE
ncbi:MAG: hypothetical protein HY858_13390 [Candidatus Solibacter usitatus]|nr:hypothetical protein [Candidatus Solibacter usitatus]